MPDIHDIVWVENPESKHNLKLARIKEIGFRGKVKLEGEKKWLTSGFRLATDTEERAFLSGEKLSILTRIKRWIRMKLR